MPAHRIAAVVVDATVAEWAYLAGFMDGEGCITAAFWRSKRWVPFVTLTQKRPEPLVYLHEIFGGHMWMTSNGAWRLAWKRINDVPIILEGVMPYLILKRPQARIALIMLEANGTNHKLNEKLRALKHGN